MPNVNAALLCAQWEQLDNLLASKRNVYESYHLFFKDHQLNLKQIPSDTEWNYWLMALQFDNRDERDAFLKYSNENGVMTRPIWQLMYKLPMYSDCQKDDQKNAEFLEHRIANIPSSAKR